MEQKKAIPHISSRLRHHILEVPNEARGVSGIVINGKRIKTLARWSPCRSMPPISTLLRGVSASNAPARSFTPTANISRWGAK